MPTMKTNRAAAKRFRRTGSGAFRHGRTNKRHLLTHKSARRRRQLRGSKSLGCSGDYARVRGMLPHA